MLTSHNIILPKYLGIVKEKGSRMSKTRAREGGASVFTALLSCFCILVPPSVRQKIPFRLRKGKAEGGCGGPEAEQVRYGVKIPPRPSRSPTVVGRSVKVRSPDFRQKKFGF